MKVTLTANRDCVPTTYNLLLEPKLGQSATLRHLTSEDLLNISYGVASAWDKQAAAAFGHTTQAELDKEYERLIKEEDGWEREEEIERLDK